MKEDLIIESTVQEAHNHGAKLPFKYKAAKCLCVCIIDPESM